MSDTKVFSFGNDGAATSNLLASYLPMLQSRGIDPSVLYAMGNGNGLGNFGINEIIALVVIAAIFGNGNGGGIFGGNNNNSAEREMLMSAIQRNGTDLSQLAQSINCSVGQVHAAVDNVATQICNLSAQTGQSSLQIINSLQSGQAALASQIAECCCKTQTAIQESNYLTERGFCNTNQILSRGFSDLGYAFANQTCDLKQTANANTASIIAKLDSIEDSRKDRELAEKDRMIATLTARSERQAELQPIYSALSDLKCNQIPVKKIACPEQYVPLNTSVNATYGLIPTCGYGYGLGYGGWNNGNCCGNSSLWG